MSSTIAEIPPINLEMFIGDDKKWKCTTTDESGVVVITDKDITFTVRDEIGGNTIFTRTTAETLEIEITNGAQGEFVVKLIPANTLNLKTDKTYYYDTEIDMSGTIGIKTVAHGRFKVNNK